MKISFFPNQSDENPPTISATLTKSNQDDSENPAKRHKTEVHAQPDDKKAAKTTRAPLPPTDPVKPAGQQSRPPPVTKAPSLPVNLVTSAKNYEEKKPVGMAKQGIIF